MSVEVDPGTATAQRLHADGVAAFEAGQHDAAAELLRKAALSAVDASAINDLAVVLAELGDRERATTLLRAALTLDPADADAQANLDALSDPARADDGAWRSSQTLGGPDVRMPERAYPGMPNSGSLSEHAMRYSLALGILAGKHLLDVGCGTAYGSEMLTWTAASVRGFDLWQPGPGEQPSWPGGAELNYGFDVCRQPLPVADAAVMFEIVEHLGDAPAALRNVFRAAPVLLASFPNPTFHGSHLNHHHVNDWSLDRFETELREAAAPSAGSLELTHFHQPLGTPLIVPGREPQAPFWIVVAVGLG